jgi:hypothetical protein
VGFVTKLEEGRDHKGVDKIENYSRFGTLLKIQKADLPSHILFERSKNAVVNYLGLTFARFKIISLSREEGRLVASV